MFCRNSADLGSLNKKKYTKEEVEDLLADQQEMLVEDFNRQKSAELEGEASASVCHLMSACRTPLYRCLTSVRLLRVWNERLNFDSTTEGVVFVPFV